MKSKRTVKAGGKVKINAPAFLPKGYRVVPEEELKTASAADDANTAEATPDVISAPLKALKVSGGDAVEFAGGEPTAASEPEVSSIVIEPVDRQNSRQVRTPVLLNAEGKPIAAGG